MISPVLSKRTFPLLVLLASLAASRSAAAEPGPIITEKVVPAGQRLVLVLDQNRPEGEAFRNEYFAQVFPQAQAQGLYDIHSFRVDEVVAGARNPRAASFFAWPSPAAAEAFRHGEVYATRYGPRRREGWVDLQSFYMDLTAPATLRLDRSKHHTVAVLWLRDAAGYEEYFKATEALRTRLGCRVVLKEKVTRYDSVRDGAGTPPDWIILVEWADREGPAQYINAVEFKALQAQHDASLAQIEMYRLAFW